jgi:error-prone DNA polymerase
MTDYIELHAHSFYSLLDGTSSPDVLVNRAAELGMTALALTDHNALYGAVEFGVSAQKAGIKPIFGAEVTMADNSHLTLLVQNQTGWRNLCTLITVAQHHAPKGNASLRYHDLTDQTEGLIALSGCRQGAMAQALLQGDVTTAREAITQLLHYFAPDQLYIELQNHLHRSDPLLICRSVALAKNFGIPYVATNNVHYAVHAGHRLSDMLLCIRENITLEQARRKRRTNSEYYLKGAAEMARLFADLPDALNTTLHIAEQCEYSLPTALQSLPVYAVPEGQTADSFLRWLCEQALTQIYGAVGTEIKALLQYELGVIGRAGLSNYFLVVWDVMDFCKQADIFAQGRGSACNSIVAYLLGISPINPVAHRLAFERFLSDERNVTPDIDIDIQADRRDEVIQYTYERWGRSHVAMACTFIRYGARSALRDMAKALDIPKGMLKPIARMVEGYGVQGLARSPEVTALAANGQAWQLLQELAPELAYLPRHLGLHNGGMVVSDVPLSERVPTEPTAYPNRSVVQWDKEMLERVNIIKLDLLGLRMLAMLAEGARWIRATSGAAFEWSSLTYEDPAVYDLITRGDTIGCFQVESRAQAQMLPRLQPRCFSDLIIAISLIRPGPLQGDMVHPFLRRRSGEEPVVYRHPALEEVLGETLGVVLWQEQVLQVTSALTGITPGQGERLRRALSKNSPDLESLSHLFRNGARARGVSDAITQLVWDQLKAFGGYSFPKSHAAAFAVLVYYSSWLKVYSPTAFYAALLNNQPMGFWSPGVILGDAKRHSVVLLPVDINQSDSTCTATRDHLRMGFNYVKGMGAEVAKRLVSARGNTPFCHLTDFCRRTQLPRHHIETLIIAGAMDSLATRRPLLWELQTMEYDERQLPIEYIPDGVKLPDLSEIETHFWEQEATGVTTGDHILSHYRAHLKAQGIVDSAGLLELHNGTPVQTAGQSVMHQAPPTAKGVHFVTLEDEVGLINLVIKPNIYSGIKAVVRGNSLLWVHGTVQRRGAVVSVLVRTVQALGEKQNSWVYQ